MLQFILRILLFPYCCMGGGSSPMPTIKAAPQQMDASVQANAMADQQRRRAAASDTNLTGPGGIKYQPTTGLKTMLGA